MKKITLLVLGVILLLGFILRVYQVDKIPPSLNWDEISHGYNAYSILKTGSDEWGKFPISNFRAYGDYPLSLNLYLTIPFITLFGLGEFSIRFPHVILGTLTIVSSYFLAKAIFKNNYLSLLVAFLVTIHPWYVFTSRFVLQSNLSVFFLITGIALFLHRSSNKYFLPLSFLCFGLTVFSYHSTRIFTPLFLLSLILIYRKELVNQFLKQKFISLLSFGILAIFFVPLPFILLQPEATARANWVFIVDQGAVNKIIDQRNNSELPEYVKRFVYNRPSYFIQTFSKNYIEYFSPKFLFFEGGTQYQFSIPNQGLLYPINIIFFYLGLLLTIRRAFNRDNASILLISWLLLAPIPAAITQEHYAVIRSTTLLPLPELFIGMGLLSSINTLKFKTNAIKIAGIVYVLILLTSSLVYINTYFGEYNKNYSWAWQYGYKEAITYAKDHYDEYDQIIITKKYGEPHEFVLFYWPWDPSKYKNDPNLVRYPQSDWFWVDRFDKFYFVNDWDIPKEKDGKWLTERKEEIDMSRETLIITSPNNYPPGLTMVSAVNFLDGQSVFDILDNK